MHRKNQNRRKKSHFFGKTNQNHTGNGNPETITTPDKRISNGFSRLQEAAQDTAGNTGDQWPMKETKLNIKNQLSNILLLLIMVKQIHR